MLPFFRKIRWRLAANNQFFKYSRYAIGEIVLVVVGILIALYINNWNEERKEKEILNSYLYLVLVNLETDLTSIDIYIDINVFSARLGDTFLLCSDGLYNMFSNDEIVFHFITIYGLIID